MNCAEADAVLPAYCDGELAGVDREQIERHLASCGSCARAAGCRRGSRRPCGPTCPGRPYRPRCACGCGAVLGAREIAPRRWLWATHPRLVPAAVAAVLLIAITGTVRHSQSMVLQQAQRSYQAELPMDIVGSDCRSIASWFRGRVDFPVPPPSVRAAVRAGVSSTCASAPRRTS